MLTVSLLGILPLLADPRPPNVLLLMADDLNTSIGAYGHPVVRTPNLDALAARGVRFDRAYCQFAWCNPSRASILTGRRPTELQVYDLRTHFRTTMPDVVTLPQYFRRRGYVTMRVGKVFHYDVPGGIGTAGADDPASWDRTVNPSGRDVREVHRLTNLTPERSLGGGFSYLAADGGDEEQTDGMIATEAIRLLENVGQAPFFLAVGFFRPHVPFVAPRKYFDLYPRESIATPQAPRAVSDDVNDSPVHRREFRDLSREQQRDVIRAYYASISFMDAQLGRVLAALERLHLAENTIVIFLSDHGFLLGEHGRWQKLELFEESVRTPLIVAAPGMARGRAVASPVELVDLFPTVLDLAHLPHPPGLAGHSLRPLLAEPDRRWPYPAISQTVGGASIRTERWCYNEWGRDGARGVELYDHVNDPGEYRNLAHDPAYAAVVLDLRARLRAHVHQSDHAGRGSAIAAQSGADGLKDPVLAAVPQQ